MGPVAICAGETTLDLIRVDDSGGTAHTYAALAGGAPVNVAAGLAAHGCESVLWSAVGRDPAGAHVRAQLARLKLRTEALGVDPEHPTRIAFIEPDAEDGRRTRIQNADSADHYLRANALPPDLATCRLFYFSGAALLGASTSEAILAALRALRARPDALVAFDPNIRLGRSPGTDPIRARFSEVLGLVDVLQVSSDRATTYFTAGSQPRLTRVPLRILTAGAGGATLLTNRAQAAIPALQATVVDTTGAGDAFLAALLAQIIPAGRSAIEDADAATLASWGRLAAAHAAKVLGVVGGNSLYLNDESGRPTSSSAPASGTRG